MRFEIIVPVVLALSFVFSLAGVGSATAVVPILIFLGEEFNHAKNAGLFINVISSSSSIHHHHSKGRMEWKIAMMIGIPAFAMAPVGAVFSKMLPREIVLLIFAIFLIYSGTVLFLSRGKKEERQVSSPLLFLLGTLTGFLAGVLGIGGGALVSPILNHLGMDPKRVARITPMTVFLSSIAGFATYTAMGDIDIYLIIAASVPAVIGGYLGAYVMHHHMSAKRMKMVIGAIYYILAVKTIAVIMG